MSPNLKLTFNVGSDLPLPLLYRAVHIDDVQDEVRQHKPIGEEAAALALPTALA